MNFKQDTIIHSLRSGTQSLIVSLDEELIESLTNQIKTDLEISDFDLIAFSPSEGVEELRKKISSLLIKPHSSKIRLFIITDADSLNDEQSNTLLKGLEEPPSYVRMILFCKNISKLLQTIRSRCQIIIVGSNKIYDQSIIKLIEENNFSEYIKLIKDLSKNDVKDLFFGGLEEIKRKGLNRSNCNLYKKLSENIFKIESTNVNVKLMLEELYINAKADKEE